MEERKDAHDAIIGVQQKDLVQLLDIRGDVVMRKHHAFGLTRRAARKNNRGDVFELRLALSPGVLFYELRRKEKSQSSTETFAATGLLRKVFEKNCFPGRLH